MTSPSSQSKSLKELPEALAALQARVETLYAAKISLEAELRQLRAMPPVVMARVPRPNVIMRLLLRLLPPLRRRRHLELIRDSGLFDPDWYRATYPDVAGSGMDPAEHFLLHGAREQRDPGPHFDVAHYLHLYPDIRDRGLNPLVHYVMSGRAEQRSIRPGMPHGGR